MQDKAPIRRAKSFMYIVGNDFYGVVRHSFLGFITNNVNKELSGLIV